MILYDNRKKKVILKQNSMCGWCECPMETHDHIQLHHVVPFKDGGTSKLNNLVAVHVECHKQLTNFNKIKKKGGLVNN